MATDTIQGIIGPNSVVDRNKLAKQGDAFDNLNMEDFIKLMVSELQNQDPLNPTDNKDMLAQLSQMQQLNSSKKLNTTLDSVLLGQNLANAGSLIGKVVNGLTEEGQDVTGKVDQATLVGNIPYLNIGDQRIPISNVRYIMPEGSVVVDNPEAVDETDPTAGT